MTEKYTPEKVAELVAELEGFAAGSESARATLMRDAADALTAVSVERDEAREAAEDHVLAAEATYERLMLRIKRAEAALSPLLNRARAEAQEAAYRHAAEVVHAEARWQWERGRGHVPGAQIVAQRMQVIEACLTGFADRVEQSSGGNET